MNDDKIGTKKVDNAKDNQMNTKKNSVTDNEPNPGLTKKSKTNGDISMASEDTKQKRDTGTSEQERAKVFNRKDPGSDSTSENLNSNEQNDEKSRNVGATDNQPEPGLPINVNPENNISPHAENPDNANSNKNISVNDNETKKDEADVGIPEMEPTENPEASEEMNEKGDIDISSLQLGENINPKDTGGDSSLDNISPNEKNDENTRNIDCSDNESDPVSPENLNPDHGISPNVEIPDEGNNNKDISSNNNETDKDVDDGGTPNMESTDNSKASEEMDEKSDAEIFCPGVGKV